jgi:hypothetical protein
MAMDDFIKNLEKALDGLVKIEVVTAVGAVSSGEGAPPADAGA